MRFSIGRGSWALYRQLGRIAVPGRRARLRPRRPRPRGRRRRGRRTSASASRRAQSASSSSEKCVITSRRAPARRPCSPASPGVRCPRRPVALGARQRRLDQQQRRVARELAQLVVGRAVGAEGEAAPSPSRSSTALVGHEVRHGLEARARAARARTSRPARTPSASKAPLDVLARASPCRAQTRRNASAAPAGAISRGRAGVVGAGVPADRHGLLARRVGQRGGVRHEVEDVVGVQVGDDDRVDLPVVAGARAACRTRRSRSRAAGCSPSASTR